MGINFGLIVVNLDGGSSLWGDIVAFIFYSCHIMWSHTTHQNSKLVLGTFICQECLRYVYNIKLLLKTKCDVI